MHGNLEAKTMTPTGAIVTLAIRAKTIQERAEGESGGNGLEASGI